MRSRWFKSSFSGSEHTCVEVRFAGPVVLVRDSKYLLVTGNEPATQPVIEVDAALWLTFLDVAIGSGRSADGVLPDVEFVEDGNVSLRSYDGVTLTFTSGEWAAFVAGVRAAEFQSAA